jgi:hypothetical protein
MNLKKYDGWPLNESPKTGDKIKTILEMFIGEDKLREFMLTPFRVGDNIYATDAYIIIWMDKSIVKDWEQYPEIMQELISKAVPKSFNMNTKLSLKKLKSEILRCDTEDEMIQSGNPTECPACHMDGVVEWEFNFKGIYYTDNFDCPVCNGSGVIDDEKIPTGNKILTEYTSCRIGQAIFRCRLITKMLNAAIILGEKDVTVVYQTGRTSITVFKVGEIYIGVMPTMDEEATFTINLK